MFFKKDEVSKILEDFKNYAYKDKEFLQFMKGLRSLYEKSIEEVMKPMVDVIVYLRMIVWRRWWKGSLNTGTQSIP